MNEAKGNATPSRRTSHSKRFIDSEARSSGSRSYSTSIDERSVLGRAPVGGEFIGLLKAFRRSGGTAPGSLFAPLYAHHRFEGAPSLQDLIDCADLFGFQWRGDFWIPLFQFDADRFTIRAVAREARHELPSSWSGWDLATWFAQPNVLLEDQSPVDTLDACGGDVLVAARSHQFLIGAKATEVVMRYS